MCCFSQPVELVANTSIFARGVNGQQFLVYSMTYAAAAELAMVLPLPVPVHAPEDAVRFINLEAYPGFFGDLERGFPKRLVVTLSAAALSLELPKLRVHDVGGFEASFVPRVEDFDRLDERFRMTRDVWDQLPAYRDYGFAVFKLKASGARRQVHPMAFTLPRRDPDQLFFPTVHVHDGQVHPEVAFDHMLYCQAGPEMDPHLQDWERSAEPASEFTDAGRAAGIVDPSRECWRLPLEGRLENRDAFVGKDGSVPRPRQFFRLSYRTPEGAVGIFAATRPEVWIGSTLNCDVCIRHLGIANLHAKLVAKGGRVWLHATSPKLETRLNGVAVTEAALTDGDTFACGPVEFRFEDTSRTLR